MSLWQALQEAELPAVLAAVRALPGWDDEAADAVHAAALAWCERTLAAPLEAGDESAAALYDYLGRLRSAHGEAALDAARPGTAAAWRAFEELLNERQAQMARGADQHALILKRRHVPEVLALLREAPGQSMASAELRERLGVGEATLSQVLSRMAAAQLVLRERGAEDGRTRRICLALTAAAAVPAKRRRGAKTVGPLADQPHRGMVFAFALAA